MGNAPDPLLDEDDVEVEEELDGFCPNRNQQGKVPKRVLKAERERLKREQLNDHFSKLASVLDLSEQNNGKACILREAIRLVTDMLSEIQCLRRDNAALLSEWQYVTTEKDELKDENSALESQIKKIQSEIEERVAQSKPDLNVVPRECWQAETASHFADAPPASFPAVDPTLQQPPILGPLYVIPVGPDVQAFSKPAPSNVSKPHARYPTLADSWPLQLLEKLPEENS
ncbi:hypothetical protein Nepgr_003192 [Nepenthes gracilis]|uniref:BHLH domain-containing protein n=1 Tax=Nepenthes gracilis TaxID=150966 RepID=A0AAD3RZ29_NEPGR|nr:hypothetical protein Nepgr_003192 [Nepenthes gracilis]